MSDVGSLIESYQEDQKEIVKRLREIVLSSSVKMNETVKWNVPTFYINKNICSIVVHKKHINLQLFYGARLADPHGVLEGTGKGMRHIKIREATDINVSIIKELIKEAIKLDS